MAASSPQGPREHSISADAMSIDNHSLYNLRMELDSEVDLLRYLPYHRTTFQPQQELAGAAPERLLYGDMVEEKGQLWIYFTMLGGGSSHNDRIGSNKMLSFYTLKGAQDGEAPIQPGKVKEVALASQPFKAARDYWEIIAIAKYFFIKRGAGQGLKKPISAATFKEDLIRACRDYKMAFEQQGKSKKSKPTAGEDSRYATPSATYRNDGNQPTEPPRLGTLGNSSDLSAMRLHVTPVNVTNPRKRAASPGSHSDNGLHPRGGQPVTPRLATHNTPTSGEPPNTAERNKMVDEYIVLQAEEEEFDNKIMVVERKRLNILENLGVLQAELREADTERDALMQEKANLRAAKKRLQATFKTDEHFDVGFEAGRKMESKRLRKE